MPCASGFASHHVCVCVCAVTQRQVPKPVTVSDDIDPLVYNAVLTVGPQLIGLVPRTENPAIRSVALLTLARLAYTPATAKLLIRLGAFQMILAFFPYCKSPEILSVEPDMLDTAAFPSFEPFPTRVPMARRSDPRASGTGQPFLLLKFSGLTCMALEFRPVCAHNESLLLVTWFCMYKPVVMDMGPCRRVSIPCVLLRYF